MTTQLTWNQFLSACSTAWKSEGKEEKTVHSFLLRCEKTSTMTLNQIASSAYKLYKQESR